MKKGKVKISKQLIHEALNFPPDWDIESISYKNCDPYVVAIISGSDFPEMTDIEYSEIKDCEIIVHKENISFEVRVLN